ncbi:hypothetical protein LX16_0637 [Stackebrandtia albiflava]|uniref:Uncharacterized protein n=1 Tax=Stackebrandtia albiflava TaxID=406432 RepID=A0A562VAR4_9ACTN|nr:hypothetical protein [Stackebrandtia albiflava]TWJ14943.1 hypothetical protein LX16_0637 [Stackebrandtia albiflava]
MTVLETLLIFVGAPLAVIAVITGLVYGTSGGRNKRYRPGRDYEFAPVWFLARPGDVSIAGAAEYVAASEAGEGPKALESSASAPRAGVKGGASGNW